MRDSDCSEVWRCVADYEGLYDVSNLGRVRSLYFAPPRVLRLGSDSCGYPTVMLTKAGARKPKVVHVLVCRAFCGSPTPVKREVGHLDGDRSNARATNLRWVSKLENHFHKRVHGTLLHGERHPSSKLTAAQALDVRTRALAGESPTRIGRDFGVDRRTVACIRDGLRWRATFQKRGDL